ncbi:serine/threonine protein kinase, partial [Streptomyces nogalater]
RARAGPVTLALAAVLAAGAAAVVVTVDPHRDGGGPDRVRITDAGGRVTLTVPAGWGRELRGSGWDPRVLGLAAGHEPGLVVADDLSRWPDLTAPVDGVFAGVSARGDVIAEVAALTHPGCRYTGARDFADARWHGLVRSWSGCPDGGSVTESALAPAGGAARPQVYVQIRQRGDGDATDGVLRSLRLA